MSHIICFVGFMCLNDEGVGWMRQWHITWCQHENQPTYQQLRVPVHDNVNKEIYWKGRENIGFKNIYLLIRVLNLSRKRHDIGCDVISSIFLRHFSILSYLFNYKHLIRLVFDNKALVYLLSCKTFRSPIANCMANSFQMQISGLFSKWFLKYISEQTTEVYIS